MSSCDRLRFGTIKPGFSSGGSEGAEVSSFSADAAGAPPVTEAWPPSNAKVAALHLDGAAAHASEGTAAIAEDRLKDPAFQADTFLRVGFIVAPLAQPSAATKGGSVHVTVFEVRGYIARLDTRQQSSLSERFSSSCYYGYEMARRHQIYLEAAATVATRGTPASAPSTPAS
jgi:hypothetical protein